MKKSFYLFLISITIIALTLLVSSFWTSLELGDDYRPLALTTTLAACTSTFGFILGLIEYRRVKSKKVMIGIIGNLAIMLFFLGTVTYALLTL